MNRCRLLAIETRSQKMGYAVFDGPRVLLDWGVREFTSTRKSPLDRKFGRLLDDFRPTMILLSYVSRNGHLVEGPMKCIQEQAASRAIPFKLSSKDDLRKHFARAGRWNKRQIAKAVTNRFPELAWHLP